MSPIIKHEFEAVSLLTTNNGRLEVTIIPAMNQPNWILPSHLLLSVEETQEHIQHYSWQQQQVAVFHLLPPSENPDKIIVLEGNTPAHRIGLQTAGELQQMQVRLSEVKDIELPESYLRMVDKSSNANNLADSINEWQTPPQEQVIRSYLFQTVMINELPYLIPDLDKIAHYLANSDSE